MLLVVDVGNTNTVLGVYQGHELLAHWRIETKRGRTGDEYAVLTRELFRMDDLEWPGVKAGMISSVVPSVRFSLDDFFRRQFGVTPMTVGPGVKTGMPVLVDNPAEVGADRIVNAIAAYQTIQSACIVVDFGTATTFDAVSAKGEYMGGAIAPGLLISADALYHAAAKLPRVELVRPRTVVGRNTVASIQAGMVFGYAGLVDAIVRRMKKEMGVQARCVATGGLAPLIASESETIEETDEMLTLRGLKIVYELNQP